MKRKYYACLSFLLLSLLWSLQAGAQAALERQVAAAGGGSGQAGEVLIQYTIGEPAVTALSAGDLTLTQGFQQPVMTTLPSNVLPIANLIVYPNPASSIVKVQFDLLTEAGVQYRVYNSAGQLMHKLFQQYGPGQVITPLSVSRFAKGTYVIVLYINGKEFARKLLVQ